jgi:hypothetical protein
MVGYLINILSLKSKLEEILLLINTSPLPVLCGARLSVARPFKGLRAHVWVLAVRAGFHYTPCRVGNTGRWVEFSLVLMMFSLNIFNLTIFWRIRGMLFSHTQRKDVQLTYETETTRDFAGGKTMYYPAYHAHCMDGIFSLQTQGIDSDELDANGTLLLKMKLLVTRIARI